MIVKTVRTGDSLGRAAGGQRCRRLAQTVRRRRSRSAAKPQVSVAPDLAQIDGGVTNEAKTAREASDANNKAMAAILPALKAAGIAEADIQTSRLSLYPQSAPVQPNGPLQITGYRASNRVTIRIRDVTKVASTLDALVTAGANEIGGINFMVSQESKALDEARGEGDRGRTAQGRDLRQGGQRSPRHAAQRSRGRRRRAGIGARARFKTRRPRRSARRRDAADFGDGVVRDREVTPTSLRQI